MSTYPGQEKPPPGVAAAPVAVQPVPGGMQYIYKYIVDMFIVSADP